MVRRWPVPGRGRQGSRRGGEQGRQGEEIGFRLSADGGEARVPRVPVEPLAMSDEEDRERRLE
jgi:hypothetical protein